MVVISSMTTSLSGPRPMRVTSPRSMRREPACDPDFQTNHALSILSWCIQVPACASFHDDTTPDSRTYDQVRTNPSNVRFANDQNKDRSVADVLRMGRRRVATPERAAG